VFNLFAAAAAFALGEKVVLQAPGKRHALGMRATGDTPVAATNRRCAPVVHVGVIDIGPRTDIGGRPALVGIRKALAPAAGAFGCAEAGGGGVGRAVQRAVIQRQRGRLGLGVETPLGIVTCRSKSSCLCIAVAAATQAFVDVAARGLGTFGCVAHAGTKLIRAAQTSKPGHGARGRPSPVLEI